MLGLGLGCDKHGGSRILDWGGGINIACKKVLISLPNIICFLNFRILGFFSLSFVDLLLYLNLKDTFNCMYDSRAYYYYYYNILLSPKNNTYNAHSHLRTFKGRFQHHQQRPISPLKHCQCGFQALLPFHILLNIDNWNFKTTSNIR